MTANELADKLQELDSKLHLIELFKAATMLRQQQAELDAFKLNYYNTGYSLQLRDKDETIKQQQAEIEALKEELKRYADEIGEERGNKALRNNEIGKILTKVLDDCGLLKKASEK